ncbi:MAG: hypothetical protein K5695_10920 [Oscillospiraceae bacterium]|nr:hypothetical protein [Oscillospiraceae bacterium]
MKNDDQMYQSVLSRRAVYRQTQEKRRRTTRRITPVLACACLAVVLGVGYWNHFRNMPTIPTLPESSQALTTETTVETGSTEVPSSESTEFPSTAATVPTETEPAATAETLLPTDATEPEFSEDVPESSAEESQQEQPHTDPPVTEQIQPSTQPPTEPTVQPAAQEMTGVDTGTQDATVVPEGSGMEFDEPPPHILYIYARIGEEKRIYKALGLEVSEKEFGDYLCDAEMFSESDYTKRTIAQVYLVKDRSSEELIAVHFSNENGYYLYEYVEDVFLPD